MRKYIILIPILAFLVILISVAAFLFVGGAEPSDNITWGATFGHSRAEELGLDWQETYLALLDDVQLRNFRIPVYWDELEPSKGEFRFDAWDWQLDRLSERGGKAFLAVGMKLPRWPECRMPEWAEGLSIEKRNREQLRMMREVVERYSDHEAVWGWQIENEPFLTFGDCPESSIEEAFLDEQIELVRSLDPDSQIIITDTGEHSFWWRSPPKADVFASTLFRVIHHPWLGFVRYKYPPVMYHRKAQWVQWRHPDVRVMIGELQAEPWVTSQPLTDHSLEDQYETMNPDMFAETFDYAKRTGLNEFYLWGAEWWYWAKTEAGDDRIWEIAKDEIRGAK